MHIARYTPNELIHLPALPGIYTFYNAKEEVIYVGKAKNIRKRVGDYFTASKIVDLKTQCMVIQIATITYTVVDSEYEALLLENNLIKELQPRYNILLKDGKRYPYLCVTHDRFPRLIITRTTLPALGRYYGPFTSAYIIKQTLTIIKQLFTFRTCNYNLSAANIANNKFKLCLAYHLGHCKGACQGLQDEINYQKEIAQIEALLKKDFTPVKNALKAKIVTAVAQLEYKKAQHFKEKLDILEQYQSKSIVINPQIGDLDIIAVVVDQNHIFVGYLHVKQGAISFTQHRVVTTHLDEEITDLLPLIICTLRTDSKSNAKEVLTNLPLEHSIGPFAITPPKTDDKRKLVELAIQNAFLCKKDFLDRKSHFQEKTDLVLIQLQNDLKLQALPYCIECFDNSNIQGDHPVAAMVCFKNGKPSKKDYRHYNIKTVSGINDVASIYEVVKRRYSDLVKRKEALPQLIVVDGGKGQRNAALLALQEIGIHGQVAVVSIAKRLELLYLPNQSLPHYLDKQSPTLNLLQQLRNEAHRFAITFHRNKRSKALFYPIWKPIPGIGPKTLHKLLTHFHTIAAISKASLDALTTVIGTEKAKKVYNQFILKHKKDLDHNEAESV